MIVIAASSKLPSMFSIRSWFCWINWYVLMVTKSPGYETGLEAYCIIKKIVVMWDSNPPVYHNDLIQVNNRVLKHQNVGYEHYIHWDWDLGLLLFHNNISINKNLTIVTAIAIPNTTNTSISYLFYTTIYELTL